MQVSATIQKHEQSSRIVSLKAVCGFVVFPLSTFSGFFIFAAVSFFAFGFLSIFVLSSSTPHQAIGIKATWSQWLLFPGSLDPTSLTPGGPVVLLACSFRTRDNLLAWRDLFTDVYDLKSRIWFWQEYILFKRIHRVFIFVRFLSNFARSFQE